MSKILWRTDKDLENYYCYGYKMSENAYVHSLHKPDLISKFTSLTDNQWMILDILYGIERVMNLPSSDKGRKKKTFKKKTFDY